MKVLGDMDVLMGRIYKGVKEGMLEPRGDGMFKPTEKMVEACRERAYAIGVTPYEGFDDEVRRLVIRVEQGSVIHVG